MYKLINQEESANNKWKENLGMRLKSNINGTKKEVMTMGLLTQPKIDRLQLGVLREEKCMAISEESGSDKKNEDCVEEVTLAKKKRKLHSKVISGIFHGIGSTKDKM